MVVTRKQDQGTGGVEKRSKAHAGRCQYQVA